MMDSLLLYKILKHRTGAEISASGNPAIMSDTLKNNPMNEMKVFGWSKQESTTGANLIDVDSMLNECLVKNDDGTYSILKTETNRFSKRFPVNLTAGTAVRFGADVIEYNGAYRFNLQISLNYQTISVGQGIILDRDVTEVAIYQDSKNDVGTYTKFKNAILSIGKAQISYEPYTGGKPSPSPEYPQEIVSAGAGGEVEVTICGKNLFDGNTDISKTQYYKLPIQMKKGAKLTMSFIGVGTGSGAVKAYCHDSELNFCNTFFYFDVKNGVNKYSSTVTCSGGEKNIFFYKTSFTKLFEKIYDIQIEINDVATDYTPYRESQSLSISTPTGLPAIPVDSDGNYTDANGQQWIADYVDLKRGKLYKKVTRLNLKDVDTMCIAHGFHSNGNGYLSIDAKNMNKKYSPISNRYKSSGWTMENGYVYAPTDNVVVIVDDRFTDKQTAIKLVQNTYVIYVLTSQIETDLTPEEIQAYKNLVTYAGTTIVENDAECYMEVSAGGGDSLRAKKLALILGD